MSKARLDALRDVRLSTRSIWGPHVVALFDDYYELTNAWHNALATFYDDINGLSSAAVGCSPIAAALASTSARRAPLGARRRPGAMFVVSVAWGRIYR